MNILNSFDYVKTFITKIRKDKIPSGLSLLINTKYYTDEELASIMFFEGTIKKLCKLNEIVYTNTGKKYGVSANTIRAWKMEYEK